MERSHHRWYAGAFCEISGDKASVASTSRRQLGALDLTALSIHLGDARYAMGDRPCSLDAVCFAFLAVILFVPLDTALKRHVFGHPNHVNHTERMQHELGISAVQVAARADAGSSRTD